MDHEQIGPYISPFVQEILPSLPKRNTSIILLKFLLLLEKGLDIP
jgi:hypothetical protein